MISRSALTAGAVASVRAGGRIADLRRDAWGHGILAVAQAVTAAGAEKVIVDSEGEIEALRLEGIVAVTSGDADIDPALLYGLPDEAGTFATRPVMRLTGHALSTKRLRAGDAVSYGYTYRAPADTTVVLVTGGYAQGIVRCLGNQGFVDVDGIARPIIGRVAMDVCVVDLDGTYVEPGAEITYFGGRGTAKAALAQWSAVTGMSPDELLTVAGAHAAREWEWEG